MKYTTAAQTERYVDGPRLYAYLDESFIELKSGQKRILVGAAVTADPDSLSRNINEAVDDVLAQAPLWESRTGGHEEPFERRGRFQDVGFHFTEDSPAIRRIGLKAMLQADVRLHVIHSDSRSAGIVDTDVHRAMLFTLAHTILRRYAGAQVVFVFENANDEIERYFGAIVERATRYIDSLSGARGTPRAVAYAKIGYKPLGGLSAADYAIGVANLDLSADGKLIAPDRELLHLAAPHVAHIMSFDSAQHRRKFAKVEPASWTSHIKGMTSYPPGSKAIPTLIGASPAGPFSFVSNARSLASALGYTPEALAALIDRSGRDGAYVTFPIRVRGRRRTVHAVKDEVLRTALKRAAYLMAPAVGFLHPSCVAYVPGRGARDAAHPHVGAAWVQKMDIKSFFESTTVDHVRGAFEDFGAGLEASRWLSDLVTLDGRLPAGSPASPMVSNLVLANLDYEIDAWANGSGLRYTRYADDLIFSGPEEFDATQFVSGRLSAIGYKLNVDKTIRRKMGQRLTVAGLTIQADFPRVPKRLKHRLRYEVHRLDGMLGDEAQGEGLQFAGAAEFAGDELHRFQSLQGLARYCLGIEPVWTRRLLDRYESAGKALIPRRASRRQAPSSAGWLADLEPYPKLDLCEQQVGLLPIRSVAG